MKRVYYVIQNKTTNEEGIARLLDEQSIRVYYGRDNGEDDKTISHQYFFEKFNIIGFIFED